MARWKSKNQDTSTLVDRVKEISHPLESNADLDAIIDSIGDKRFVLLGEASHGTSEYYTWRARLSQRLIQEKGFSFIAVEGDWPDCYKINRYVKNYPGSGDGASRVLHAFDRWPTWMWANWEVAALAEWIRKYNAQREHKVGFYGLDVYSLYESMRMVVGYLEKKDAELAKLARQAYHCFEPYGEDVQSYAWRTRMTPESCEDEVLDLLMEMQRGPAKYDSDPEAAFNAEQNALILVDAERYYRAMVRSDMNSWNVRDIHMADTLDRLMQHHASLADGETKAIICAHNTHIGDARATDMASEGMVNLGQLVRERQGADDVFLVGFGSHHGTVIAGQEWEAPMQAIGVPDAVENSWEDVLHRTGQERCILLLQDQRDDERIAEERGHRAIGVVYNPQHERYGNYVPTLLPHRYDAFIFIDETQALHPLHLQIEQMDEEAKLKIPETYPWGV